MIDTNVLLSAVVFPSPSMKELIERITTEHTLMLCSHIIEELQEVFDRKFKSQKTFLNVFLSKLSYDYIYTPTDINPKNYPEIRDKEDLPILVSALIAGVDLIITGDKDFFHIEASQEELPLILTPKDFLQRNL
jgi:putative PIN family toxin of toxin-antitoxin system